MKPTLRSFSLHSHWIWRQQSSWKRFGIKHSALIAFMMNTSWRDHSSRGSMDRFGIACTHIGAWRKMLVHELARHTTSLPNYNADRVRQTHCTHKSRWTTAAEKYMIGRIPKKLTAAAYIYSRSTTASPIRTSSILPLPVMALQLPSSKACGQSASSSTSLDDNAACSCLCLNTTQLTSRCNLVPEQLRTLLMNQRSANLPSLLFLQASQLYRHPIRSPDLKGGNVRRPLQLQFGGQLQQLLGRGLQSLLWYLPHSLRQKPKDRGQTGGSFRKIIPSSWWRCPWQTDKDYRDKRRRSSFHQSQSPCSRQGRFCRECTQSTPINDIQGLPSNAQYAVDIAYDLKSEKVGSFFCRPTCPICISINILTSKLLTVEILLYTGAGQNLTKRSFCPRSWHNHTNPTSSPNMWTPTKQSVRIDGIIRVLEYWWPPWKRQVWICLESCHWRAIEPSFIDRCTRPIFPSECSIIPLHSHLESIL